MCKNYFLFVKKKRSGERRQRDLADLDKVLAHPVSLLFDQHRNPNINNKDHMVGQLSDLDKVLAHPLNHLLAVQDHPPLQLKVKDQCMHNLVFSSKSSTLRKVLTGY